ncbi:S-layer homology domain-containing protein [Brevibacillus humidisoli]|uniref:S-layer homology domain-containing protein n=1 Tax=Brevibacillus humidisoli TaxID=2895522 RepID=UPI001E3AE9C3|nr:S-layer homology domain-containing protein [Brevibacillus humidisoli]UFJ41549.1 S-layer homology domain-containing protein [Brevibacillus humidisoli]
MGNRILQNKNRQISRLALSGALAGVVVSSVLPLPLAPAAPSVYAAEMTQATLSEEKALQVVEDLVTIPDEYELRSKDLSESHPFTQGENPVWSFHWQMKGKDGFINGVVDAVTGKLIRFSIYGPEVSQGKSDDLIGEKEAETLARTFLEKAAEEEQQVLSEPNQYENKARFYQPEGGHSFTFTRMVEGVPFLENYFSITVDGDGTIINFERNWYPGDLPQQEDVQELEKSLEELAYPSLAFVRLGYFGREDYKLVYRYGPDDVYAIDALDGSPLNRFGQTPGEGGEVKPLGSTVSGWGSGELISRQTAEKRAKEWIKKLPGEYRFVRQNGSGSSTGADGITNQHWSFQFDPVEQAEDQTRFVELEIDDRGQLVGYSYREEGRFPGKGTEVDSPISWQEAEESAVQFVKTLFADHLGEIYLIEQEPTEEEKQQMLEWDRGYEIRFGLLQDGIPVEDFLGIRVFVDVESAEVIELRSQDLYELAALPNAEAAISAEQAREVELQQKQPMLTYFLPAGNWLYRAEQPAEPRLVYRYVGEEGYVDAVSGKWHTLAELNKKQQPQDIEDHPAQEALQFAVDQNYLQVQDGQVGPDKQVTRGEFAAMLARLSHSYPLHRRLADRDEEAEKLYRFSDLDQSHPHYAAIQQIAQLGLVPDDGRFEPDRPITRIEASEMVLRLIGYGSLIEQPEIFTRLYDDVSEEQQAIAALAKALGLWGNEGSSFQPDAPLTRAAAATMVYQVEHGEEE